MRKLILSLLLIVFGTSVAAAELPTFRIGYMPITDHLILGVAANREAKNFSALKLETLKFTDWATLSEAFRSGSLEGAFLLAPLAFQTRLKGAPAKIVLLGHRDGSALIVRVKGSITGVQDLRGTTIAIPARFSTHNFLLHLYTTAAGLAPGVDFKTIEMPPPEMPAALAGGTIDGYIVAEPFGARGELLNVGKVLVLSSDIWKHHPDCLLVLREDTIAKNPKAVDELLQGLIRAGIYTEENRESAAEIGKTFLGQPVEAIRHALTKPSKERVTFYDLLPLRDELEKIERYMAEKMGLFPVRVNFDELLDTAPAERAYSEVGTGSRDLEYQPRK